MGLLDYLKDLAGNNKQPKPTLQIKNLQAQQPTYQQMQARQQLSNQYAWMQKQNHIQQQNQMMQAVQNYNTSNLVSSYYGSSGFAYSTATGMRMSGASFGLDLDVIDFVKEGKEKKKTNNKEILTNILNDKLNNKK